MYQAQRSGPCFGIGAPSKKFPNVFKIFPMKMHFAMVEAFLRLKLIYEKKYLIF